MQFKKIIITNFIKKTLQSYVIIIDFSNKIGKIKISEVVKLKKKLEDYYDIEPELVLLPKPGEMFELGLGPLTFQNKKTQNNLQIGRDFIQITFKEYENWNVEYPKIKEICNNLNEIFQGLKVKNIRIKCSDEFTDIKRAESFKLKECFTHFVNSNFPILFDDFHLGFVPHEIKSGNINEKIVLRLRGILSKNPENYHFVLESLFLKRNIDLDFNEPKVLKEIYEGHDFLDYLFVKSLTENYRKKLGLEYQIEE